MVSRVEGIPVFLFAGCFVLLASAWSAEISIGSYAGNPGSSVPALISFAGKGDSVSGIQADLEYDSSIMSVAFVLADKGREAQKTLSKADSDSNRKRILLIGFNRNLLSDGALVQLFINLKSGAPAGMYPLKLSRLVCWDQDGHVIPGSTVNGSITISATPATAIPISQDGVLNAASLRPSPVAPGEVITLIGSAIGPVHPVQNQGDTVGTVLDGIRVLMNGIAAPLLYVSSDQINAVAPYALSGSAAAQLVIEVQGQKRAELTLAASDAEPGIFTFDSSGTGPGAILNEDGSSNTPSNPAARGSLVSLFVTGVGRTDPLAPISVQLAETMTDAVFIGAPGLIPGVWQLRARVPENIESGYAVPVFIQVGAKRSQTGVTIAVK